MTADLTVAAPDTSEAPGPADGRPVPRFDVGLPGYAHRLGSPLIAHTLDAEVTGATSIWFTDHLRARTSPDAWRHHGGARAVSVPDPHALADPFVAATAALLVSRRATVGVRGIDLRRRSPSDLARAAVTLAHLAPGRFVLGLGARGLVDGLGPIGDGDAWTPPTAALQDTLGAISCALAHERPSPADRPGVRFADAPRAFLHAGLEVVVEGSTVAAAALAGRHGAGWLPSSVGLGVGAYAQGVQAAEQAAAAARHDWSRMVPGLVVEAVIHEDEAVVASALASRLVGIHLAIGAAEGGTAAAGPEVQRLVSGWVGGEVPDEQLDLVWPALLDAAAVPVSFHGPPEHVASLLRDYVRAGARRVVIDNLLPLGRPEEEHTGQRATAATLRLAKRMLRGLPIG
ncbi:MAG: LLM class flavin-dependent oxidoreductase [Acidimicrobiales bacterium]